MRSFSYYWAVFKLRVREELNYVFGPIRRYALGTCRTFTIISNNCWGGHVYRYFRLPYLSPTVGLYMFSGDYVKFVYGLKEYTSMPLQFITYQESKYFNVLKARGGDNITCPIARIGDIEVIFLHYKTPEEAKTKWMRRCERIVWDHLLFKMSEQNLCSFSDMEKFDSFNATRKLLFVHKSYGLQSEIVYKEFSNDSEVLNDTNNFRKYVNLIKWVKGTPKYSIKR